MDEQDSSVKGIVKGVLKTSLKKVLIVVIIASLILGLVPMLYTIFKDDYNKLSEKNNTYSTKVKNGQVTYVKTSLEGSEQTVTRAEMASDFKSILKTYIDGDDEYYNEKVNYLIGAETVTKIPYIEPSGDNTEEQLIGQIKFYRYTDESQANDLYEAGNGRLKEKYRLTYIAQNDFSNQKSNYESNGNKEIFKHFTMDDEGNVIIAYGSQETRTIKTNGDSDISLDMVKEKSGEESYTGNYKDGFEMTKYTIYEEQIDYLSLVEQYIMPRNLLYSLLIQTRDIDFVEAIASLAYENEIAIGIYDNQNVINVDETYNYKKMMEISVETSLDVAKVNITNPVINSSTIKRLPNTPIAYRCYTQLSEDKYTHTKIYYGSNANETKEISNDFYISTINSDGKITALGNTDVANKYEIKFNKTKIENSVPTVGVILANTWMANGKATYVKEEKEPIQSNNGGNYEENLQIATYNELTSFVQAFDENQAQLIQNQLDSHAKELHQEAVTSIFEYEKPLIQVKKKEIKVEDITEAKKKQIFITHYDGCASCLMEKEIRVPNMPFFTGEEAFYELNGIFKNTIISEHYQKQLQAYIKTENAKVKGNKAEIEKQIKENLNEQIEYQYNLQGKQYDTEITFTSTRKTEASKYKKEGTVETDAIGEKFSAVFNDEKFYDARQAILQREEWLWEYIRENEDTEKLEDILRYLLNIATESTDYIVDFDFENMFENMFESIDTIKSGDSELSVLREFVNSFEGSTEIVTIDGIDHYIAVGDGLAGGLATIGHGVTTWLRDYFPEEYQGWGVGSKIPVSVVDSVQEQFLNDTCLKKVRMFFPNATSYQVVAMASFVYNCGDSFLSDIKDNVDEYIADELDKFEEPVDVEKLKKYISQLETGGNAVAIKQQLIEDIDCDLYTEKWSQYVNTKVDSNVPGLIKRRYLEWMLFQYGYLYTTDSYYAGTNANETQLKIVEIAKNSSDYGIVATKGLCLGWVYDVYEMAGAGRGSQGCSFCAGREYGVSQDFSIVPIGAAVYGEGSGTAAYKWGHVGIYLGDGQVADVVDTDGDGDGDVRIITLDKWLAQNPNGCWGWACPEPVNSAYPITKGLIREHRSPCM